MVFSSGSLFKDKKKLVFFFIILFIFLISLYHGADKNPPKDNDDKNKDDKNNDDKNNDEKNKDDKNKDDKNKDDKNKVENMSNTPDGSLCHKYNNLQGYEKLSKIDNECNLLSKDSCNVAKCCVLKNNDKCVSGSEAGPSWPNKDGETEYYYWKKKCYGKCPN